VKEAEKEKETGEFGWGKRRVGAREAPRKCFYIAGRKREKMALVSSQLKGSRRRRMEKAKKDRLETKRASRQSRGKKRRVRLEKGDFSGKSSRGSTTLVIWGRLMCFSPDSAGGKRNPQGKEKKERDIVLPSWPGGKKHEHHLRSYDIFGECSIGLIWKGRKR